MSKIAWIGLGVMGFPMAGHLKMRGHHDVVVFNRTRKRADAWVATFGGTFVENSKKCHATAFEKATGASVRYVLGSSVQTAAKLRAAGARAEFDVAYMDSQIVKQAKAEGHKAKTMLDWANRAEKVHAGLFGQALAAMKAGKDLSQMEVYLCPVCGDVEFGVPPDKCPICGAPAAKFQKIG